MFFDTFLSLVEDLPLVEIMIGCNIFLYDFDLQEGDCVGESGRRSIGKFDKTAKLMLFNNHLIYTNDIDNLFKCFRCPSCDGLFNRSENFNRHFMTCKDRVRHLFKECIYTIFENLFEGFNIPVSKNISILNNLAIFDFVSICSSKRTESYLKNNLDWKTSSNFCINILETDR